MLKAVLIAASLAVAMPCFAQQVRVITGDIEHVYGPGAQVLDDTDLQARNQRAWEQMQAEKQLAIARRQVGVEIGRFRLEEAMIASYAPVAAQLFTDR
jgi:pectin methylesterase-like acyl-CoA thioesterase